MDSALGETIAAARMPSRLVAYYRVSTARQEASGLSLEAQRTAVQAFASGAVIAAEFTEAESGERTDRPGLARAISACRLYGARLVIAKLDRLSREAHFLLRLEKAGVDFVTADMPHANRLTIGIMALVAEEERRMISARTKATPAAAKARGTVLGGIGATRSQQLLARPAGDPRRNGRVPGWRIWYRCWMSCAWLASRAWVVLPGH